MSEKYGKRKREMNRLPLFRAEKGSGFGLRDYVVWNVWNNMYLVRIQIAQKAGVKLLKREKRRTPIDTKV